VTDEQQRITASREALEWRAATDAFHSAARECRTALEMVIAHGHTPGEFPEELFTETINQYDAAERQWQAAQHR
jgi:hypothetical protein